MIIAFHAEGRQSGKDTAGRFLAEWATDRGVPYERRAFGDKMKLLVALALGIGGDAARKKRVLSPVEREMLDTVDEFKLHGHVDWSSHTGVTNEQRISGREFIINLAGDSDTTGARGLFGANFWVDQCLPPYDDYDRDAVIGVTDLRFDVEADRVHELGGAVVKIEREGTEKGRSEQGIDPDKVDYVIDNNRSLDDLHAKIWSIAGSEWQNR